MSITENNLEYALTGESLASQRYLNFSEKAKEEGLLYIAWLFKAIAASEVVHARNHLKASAEKSTRENLISAIDLENREITNIYPAYIRSAQAEGNNQAAESFDLARKVEKIHYALYQSALDKLDQNQNGEATVFLVCQYCGNVVERLVPEQCTICGSPKSMFKLID